jgi:16S rRNA (adenine1518-N6/adenine1519-N6)-dimethyltransferase
MQYVKAKKSLGQHFLTDKNIALKIAESLSGDLCGTILEIGPGTGVLTEYLSVKHAKFFAVEIDKESIVYLKEHYTNHNFLIEGDFLKLDLNRFEAPIGIIGNFPYYISSQIFFKILENKQLVQEVVCMIQKEVAERIAAPPGSKTYGILSVLLQSFFTIKYLFTVHEHCFSPAPKVKSGVILLTRNNTKNLPCNEALFFRVIKQTFNQRRKTLRNSIKPLCANLDPALEILNKRPEQLSVEEFVKLTLLVEEAMVIGNRQ